MAQDVTLAPFRYGTLEGKYVFMFFFCFYNRGQATHMLHVYVQCVLIVIRKKLSLSLSV